MSSVTFRDRSKRKVDRHEQTIKHIVRGQRAYQLSQCLVRLNKHHNVGSGKVQCVRREVIRRGRCLPTVVGAVEGFVDAVVVD